ncbi:LysR substrate-binding domain-containing protein [Acuticoccus sp. I52.16.1]|uniref:LysR substrate-binding domain-containing protein n=1 Tax=Acuticoccus sp. I52.16.1 TaxID=2928472 RepID=UPI0021128D61|nr:LysR substrate-binding domain-containing protein [Acuticoccus sp. I52.16.1]
MTPRQVEVFRAIMRAGSVTDGARQLHLSQPAASKQLRLLEESLGFPLFERSKNRIVPTYEAEALAEQIEAVYSGLDELDRFAAALRHNNHGGISVATLPMLTHRWMPALLGAFATEYPNVSMSIPVRSTSWIVKAVAAGRVEMGVGLQNSAEPTLQLTRLMRLPVACVMVPDHPLAALRRIEPRELRGHDCITLTNLGANPLGLPPDLRGDTIGGRRRLESFSSVFACEFARAGIGLAIVDGLSAMYSTGDGLVARPLNVANTFDIALMTPRRRHRSRLAQILHARFVEAGAATEATVTGFFAALDPASA